MERATQSGSDRPRRERFRPRPGLHLRWRRADLPRVARLLDAALFEREAERVRARRVRELRDRGFGRDAMQPRRAVAIAAQRDRLQKNSQRAGASGEARAVGWRSPLIDRRAREIIPELWPHRAPICYSEPHS